MSVLSPTHVKVSRNSWSRRLGTKADVHAVFMSLSAYYERIGSDYKMYILIRVIWAEIKYARTIGLYSY